MPRVTFCAENQGCPISIIAGYSQHLPGFFMVIMVDTLTLEEANKTIKHPLENSEGFIYQTSEDPNLAEGSACRNDIQYLVDKLKELDIGVSDEFIAKVVETKNRFTNK